MAESSRNGKIFGLLLGAAAFVMGAYAYRVLPGYFADKAAPPAERAEASAPSAKADEYFLGDRLAPPAKTIIEFGDLECPYCIAAGSQAAQLVAAAPGYKLVWKDCPLPNHSEAFDAAVAARCAGEQGKFWEYHDLLAASSGGLGPELYASAAQGLGLDADAFAACRADGRQSARVRSSLIECAESGVQELPWFSINGKTFTGSSSVRDLSAAIQAK